MKADQQRKKKTALGRVPKTPETSVIIPAYNAEDYLQLLVGFAKSKNADYVGCGYNENSEKMGKADKDICVFPEEMYCEGEDRRFQT